MIELGCYRGATDEDLKLLSVSRFAEGTMVCLAGSYQAHAWGEIDAMPQKDRPAERELKALLGVEVDDLVCRREPDGFGEFSLRCIGAHVYLIADALNGERFAVNLFCICHPQQADGGVVAYRSKVLGPTRAERLAYRNERKSPVLPRGPDPLIEIVRAKDRLYELAAEGGNARMYILDYIVFFAVSGTAMEAFSRARGRLDE